jgi:demethylmenaquinone methyltransferase/2-methoxy-6-polyprenyl-1,4-benzoquinol methylase
MFEEISPTYDFLNRLLSFGRDSSWRRKTVAASDIRAGQRILDCAAGTGDMAVEVCRQIPAAHVVLLDPVEEMLARARKKLAPFHHANIQTVKGSAEALPFESDSFDRVVVAFGLRNFLSLDSGLFELFRVTKPGGMGAILEFTPDRHPAFRRFFRLYFMYIIRPIGALISRHASAYNYLGRSIDSFFTSSELREHFARVGWTIGSHRQFAGGVVSLFIVHK